jgi:hypothetical protein
MQADASMTVAASARDTKRLMLIAMICCLRYVDIFSPAQQAGEENISAKKYAYKHPSISTVVCVIRFCERFEIAGPDLRAPAPASLYGRVR